MNELVSVVIPCRNEAKSIEKTVRALLDNEYSNLEIIVVDGMSEDETRSILERLSAETSRVRMIDNPKRLTPIARNLGVKNTRGDYVLIVDSRNVVARDYIALLLQKLKERPDVGCVGGDYQHVYDSEEGRTICLAMESKFGVGVGNYRTMTGDAYVDTVGVPLYRQDIFREIGYFDENLTRNQDDDFNFRVRAKGYKVMYVHAAKNTYLARGSLKKAFKQFQQYGYFKVYVNKKHGALTTWRQLVPAAFLAFWGVGIPLALFEPSVWVILAVTAAVYMATGLALAGKNLSLLDRLRVLKACFVLHLGYGSGYWLGIFDFLLRHRPPRSAMQRQTL